MPISTISGSASTALTTGVSDFMTIVTTMLEYITNNAILMTAFSASFVFLAVGLVRRLKKQ